MKTHELQELDFEDALDILESRLAELKMQVSKNASALSSDDSDAVNKLQADVEQKLIELKASKLSGERDNLLTEALSLFDQIGEKVSALVD